MIVRNQNTCEKNFDDTRIKKIKKDFNELRDRFFRPKIKEKKSL